VYLFRSGCNRASLSAQLYVLRVRPLLAGASFALLLAGCASHDHNLINVERRLAADQPELALESLERQSQNWRRRDKVLYLLNRAMLLRMQGNLAGSNKAFTEAQRLIDKLYGASVTEQIGSVIINDRTRTYVGEEFEQVLLHVYMALNFLEMNRADAARVEALQIDLTLRQFSKKIANKKYIDDAFAHYLSGLIYEQQGEWSDAMIEYRKAYEAYGEYKRVYGIALPNLLRRDLLRLTAQLGLTDEHRRYQLEFGIGEDAVEVDTREGHGQLVFLLHSGLAPVKRENAVILPVPGSHTLVKIALPYYQSRSSPAKGARLKVADREQRLELAEDINAIAIHNLEVKMPAIQARALARASIKGAVVGGLNRQDQWLAGLLLQLGGLVTEHADTRTWITLPRDIYIGRVPLLPGKYTVKLQVLDRHDSELSEREFPDVQITAGHMTFLSYHWIVPTNLLFESAP
jgi:hypothetical protein